MSVSVPAIHKMAARKNWKSESRPNPSGGGVVKYFKVSSFDTKTTILIQKAQLSKPSPLPPGLSHQYVPSPIPSPSVVFGQGQQKRALAKYDLLRLYTDRLKSAPYGKKTKARDDFINAYNTGLLYPQLFADIGPVSWKTVEGWKRDVKNAGKDAFTLVDRRGTWKRGATSINETHAKILLMCLLHPNKPKIAESIRFAREIMYQRGIENGFSDATYRRWINDWRERNYHIWTYTREGWKAWNDKCALSGQRDYDAIEVGDLAVGDGHTLNFDIINPWTGKPKRMTLILWEDMASSFPLGWEIMPTENTQAIASAMRWAILRLGKIPKAAYIDNGKAFGARFFSGQNLEEAAFTGLFERLGMQVIHARPYRGQSKVVERFFGSFAELERWAPTYTGTSIENKPPGMNRGEKLHRRIREQMVGGGITLEQAHMAIAEWFDRYIRRPQQDGHLKGLTPLEVFSAGKGPGVDREQLDDLMMDCRIRAIRRSTISLPGNKKYYHRELHGRTHSAIVRYDLQDPSYIKVYERTGEYICTAELQGKLHPAARILGTEEDRQRVAEHCAEHRSQEKAASSFASRFLQDEFLPAHRKQMQQIGIEPLPIESKTRPAIAPPGPQPKKQTISDEEWAAIQAQAHNIEVECIDDGSGTTCDILNIEAPEIEEDAMTLRARLEALPEDERYIAILEMEIKGQMVPDRWRDFARYFENTLVYLDNRDHFETVRGELAVQWQAEIGERAAE